jgi:hypothetical protein
MKYPIRTRRYVRLRNELFARVCALVVIVTLLFVQLVTIFAD